MQGGGAHGAFTWGVLDRLLEDEQINIGWISGASAGAVNAVAVAAGLAENGRDGARARLRKLWEAVHKAGVPDFLRLNPFLYSLSRNTSLAQVASLMSPYEFNPLGFDPLRKLLSELIDFEALRRTPGPELLLSATEVATGRARIFRRKELTIETVLASSCLPTLHRAIEIDGIAYWDGGFSANPDLVTLAGESPIADTLVVLVNPFVRHGLPTGAREISSHANRLTFNAPLLRDIQILEVAKQAERPSWGGSRNRLTRLARHRFHLVEAQRYTSALSDDSKMKPDLGLLNYLHTAGRTEAGKWLDANRRRIGKRSTVNLRSRFLETSAAELQPGPAPIREKPAA